MSDHDRKKPPIPPPAPDDPDDEELDEPVELVVAAQVALEEDEEDDDGDLDLALPDEEHDDAVWEPVSDADVEDLDDPARLDASAPDTTWDAVEDAATEDLAFDPSRTAERVDDPWDALDAPRLDPIPPPSTLPVLPPPAASTLLLPTPTARTNAAPRTVPWRLTAEIVEPLSARMVAMTDPRLEASQLLVASWEWADGDEEHVRFRLTDDGGDTVVRVSSAGQPIVPLRIRMAGVAVLLDASLVVDRTERGLLLGRDALAGRFLIDPAREDWP